jgi:peptidoglycan/LPS O-acetylase OafA/YrhL
MYYLGILFFSVVNSNVTKASIIANIFFIHGWHPDWVTRLVPGGWSISVEMFFYCLVPFLVKKINSLNKAIYWFIAAVLFNYLFQQVLGPYAVGDFLFFSFPNHMPVFICGIAAYMLIIKKDFLVGSKPLLFVSLLILAYMIWNDLINYVTLSGIAFMLLLIAVSKRRFKVLVNPFFTYLGKVSYSSYLVHFAVLLALNKFHFVDFIDVANTYTGVINYILRLIVVVGITIGISTLFYRFVEVPMQQVGRNLIKLCSPTLLPSQPKRLS